MRVFRPNGIEEAIALQQENQGYYLAGGTYSMVEIYNERFQPECLIDLSLCPELYGIVEEENQVRIGALTTFTDLEKSDIVRKLYPALAEAAAQVGGPQVRNRGTVGGNLCAASPAADAAPPLLALEAVLVVQGVKGERSIPVKELFTAPRKTCLMADEIAVCLLLPKQRNVSAFYKVGKRSAMAVSSINMAMAAVKEEGILHNIVVAAGSCAPTPRICPRTSQCLEQGGVAALEETKQILMEEIAPIDDRWASAEYRRVVAQNMLENLLAKLMGETE